MSAGEMLLGPPKSKAGRRIVGILDAIIPVLRSHLSMFVKDEPGALVFPERVRTLCVSRFVERMLLAGAVWQHCDCRHGRWRRSR
jgi:hypothetical protein